MYFSIFHSKDSSQYSNYFSVAYFYTEPLLIEIKAVPDISQHCYLMTMMMMHLYSALLCIAVHPKRFTIIWGGGGGGVSPQPPPVCNVHLDDDC